MKTVTPREVSKALISAIPRIATTLPDDVLAGLVEAREKETGERARFVLDQLVDNARIANEDAVPICQDTGTVWVCLEVGPDVLVPGDVFSEVDFAVAHTYEHARLRKSVVVDALFDRTNTQDNTPAFCEIHPVSEAGSAVFMSCSKAAAPTTRAAWSCSRRAQGRTASSRPCSPAFARRRPTPVLPSSSASASALRSTRWGVG